MPGDDPRNSHQAPATADALADFASRLRLLPSCEWVDEVRRDQANRWRSGKRILLEDYFQCCPELTQNEEDTLVLIVGEAILRRRMGQQAPSEDYQRRFPHLAARIPLLLQLDQLWPSVATDAVPRIVCPVCRNETEQPEIGLSDELVCPSCGSSFRFEQQVTLDCHPGDKPRKLGKYELIEPVGVGSFGTVYKARDCELDRIVAIKVPRAIHSATKEELARFVREARSVAQLRHPGIVSVHEISQSEQTPYLVTEFVHGTTLADLLSSRRPAPREAAELVATVADALHYAHEMGVVHRDVKPANIMLDEQGAPRLMDFGLARRDAADITMTIAGQVLGTPAYMSPEQARGESRNVDGRSDVYSLGVILYQLLTGELPFRGTTQMLLRQLLQDEPRRPRSLSHLVPRDLETICLKAMAKDAPRRYATARDLADDLRRFLNDEPIRARPIRGVERAWRWCRREPALACLSAAMGILLVAIGIGGTVAALLFRIQADDARDELYFSRIAQANFVLTASSPNPGRAEDLLKACPLERRNWEWDYLKRLWRTEPVVLNAPGSREFNGIAFSHDGRQLAAACGDGKVRVWDQDTGDVVVLHGHDGFVFSVAFSPVDSGRLASAGADGHVRVWDLSSGQEILPPLPGRKPQVRNGMAYGVSYSPDGKWLAAVSEDDTVQVWDATTGRPIHRLEGHELGASCVAFSPDGKLLATGDWRGVVRLWNAKTGNLRAKLQLPEHMHPVGCLAFSPDGAGRYLAAGYFGRQLDVWDTTSGKIHRRLRGHTGIVAGVAFHPTDSRRLASSGQDRSVRIWDIAGEREALRLQDHTGVCNSLAFSPNGFVLASASSDKRIRLWDATPLAGNDRQERSTLQLDHEVWSVAVSPDGTLVAAAGLGPNVRVWDALSGVVSRAFQQQFTEVVFSLVFSPHGERLAAAGMDGGVPPYVVKVFDVQTGQKVLEHRESRAIFATTTSLDGRWTALGLADGCVQLIDAQAGTAIYCGTHASQIAMGGVTFSHDGSRLASVSHDGTLAVWDASTIVSTAPEAVQSPAPSTAVERGVRGAIWSKSRDSEFWSLAFSPDDCQLVTGSRDGQLTIWDTETGRKIKAAQRATNGEFLSATFSPDGLWIISASEDCTVQVFDAKTLERVHTFRGHLGPIRCLAVSSDSKFIASGSTDTSVKLWDLKQLDRRSRSNRASAH